MAFTLTDLGLDAYSVAETIQSYSPNSIVTGALLGVLHGQRHHGTR